MNRKEWLRSQESRGRRNCETPPAHEQQYDSIHELEYDSIHDHDSLNSEIKKLSSSNDLDPIASEARRLISNIRKRKDLSLDHTGFHPSKVRIEIIPNETQTRNQARAARRRRTAFVEIPSSMQLLSELIPIRERERVAAETLLDFQQDIREATGRFRKWKVIWFKVLYTWSLVRTLVSVLLHPNKRARTQ